MFCVFFLRVFASAQAQAQRRAGCQGGQVHLLQLNTCCCQSRSCHRKNNATSNKKRGKINTCITAGPRFDNSAIPQVAIAKAIYMYINTHTDGDLLRMRQPPGPQIKAKVATLSVATTTIRPLLPAIANLEWFSLCLIFQFLQHKASTRTHSEN